MLVSNTCHVRQREWTASACNQGQMSAYVIMEILAVCVHYIMHLLKPPDYIRVGRGSSIGITQLTHLSFCLSLISHSNTGLASNMAGHQRSTSWPPMAHPNKIRIKEALQSMSSVMSSPSTIQTVCDGLRRLGDVHGCINEVICLHSNQQAHGKRLEEEMERSLEVLDLCNTVQESFADLKMTIQELQMVLVRGDLTAARVKAQSYIRLLKKAKHRLMKNVARYQRG
jgi:hypothetical protein